MAQPIQPKFKLKRSNPFRSDMVLTDDSGAPKALSGVTIYSQIRTLGGTLVANLDFVPQPGVGVGAFTLTGSSDDWPEGVLAWDVRVELGGENDHNTDTVYFTLERPITQEADE